MTFACAEGAWTAAGKPVAPATVADALNAEQGVHRAVMGLFFSSRSHGGTRAEGRGAASIDAVLAANEGRDPLSLRWAVALEVRRLLGKDHYLSAVCACGLMRCFTQAAKAAEAADPLDACSGDLAQFFFLQRAADGVAPPMPARDPAGSWDKAFLRFLMEIHGWFETNMPGTPQHLKALQLVDGALDVVLRCAAPAGAPMDVVVASTARAFHQRHVAWRLQPFHAYPEYSSSPTVGPQ